VHNFHNLKEEITKGYDVVPQLNDNIRLTIDEYRNKLYQFIQQTKSQSSLTSKQNSTKTSSNNNQTKSEAYIRANTPAKDKPSPLKSATSSYKTNQQQDANEDYYNHSAQHNNSHTYESKSDHSDDTASSNGTPPHQNYYHSSTFNNNNNSTANNSGPSYNNSTSSLSNYNKRQKHPADYATSTNPNYRRRFWSHNSWQASAAGECLLEESSEVDCGCKATEHGKSECLNGKWCCLNESDKK